jgi:hypothetical protein
VETTFGLVVQELTATLHHSTVLDGCVPMGQPEPHNHPAPKVLEVELQLQLVKDTRNQLAFLLEILG